MKKNAKNKGKTKKIAPKPGPHGKNSVSDKEREKVAKQLRALGYI